MTHILQTYVEEFGAIVTNAFDLRTWNEATTLSNVRLDISVMAGSAAVQLVHIDGEAHTVLETLECPGKGEYQTSGVSIEALSGVLLPVVQSRTDGAWLVIRFVTDDAPSAADAKVNFVICTFRRPDYVQKNAQVFLDYLHANDPKNRAHLTIVDNDGNCGVEEQADITVYQNANTGGAGGFGRGMYETCHGAQANDGFTHICLMDDDIYLQPEMFARTAAMAMYAKPDWHLGAPMYPASKASQVPQKSACFGHKYLGSIDPADKSLMGGLRTTDFAAFTTAKRAPDTTGWWWNCIPTDVVKEHGLPYPFFVKMDDVEYSLRLKDRGLRLAVPLSFWVLHDDFEEKYSAVMQYFRYRNRIILQMIRGTLPRRRRFARAYLKLFRRFVQRAQYEHAELMLMGLEDIFKGPDHCVDNASEILARVIATVKTEKNRPMPDTPEGAMVSERMQTIKTGPKTRRKTTYWHGVAKVGYAVERDPMRAARLMARAVGMMPKLFRLSELKMEYRENRARFTTPQFWATYGPVERDLSEPAAQTVPTAPPLPKSPGLGRVTDRDQIFLNTIRNAHLGKRCFVIGNGPSLTVDDLNLLKNEYTFAANKIYLTFDETRWRPTYYSVEDRLVASNNREIITELTGMTKIFPSHMQEFIPPRPNHFFVKWRPPANNRSLYREFSEDLSRGVCWGSTITYTLMQMAVHMGFKEIYLIGVDHSYVESAQKDKDALISTGEVNHFHPEYRKPGERWHYPVLDRLEASYQHARRHCDEIGVKVFNASRFTKLTAFELRDLDEVLGTADKATPTRAVQAREKT